MTFKHVHIVACSPRSGTTLLHEAMATCFRFDKRFDHEMRFEEVSAGDDQTVLSKRPRDTRYMPRALALNPNLFCIYVIRDPRDVICSRHHNDPSRYFANIGLWRESHRVLRRLRGHDRFVEVRYEDFVNHPDSTQREIAGALPWLEQVHNFSDYHLYAEVSSASLDAMKGVRPISPASIGVWKSHLPRIKGQQLRHGSLAPDLIEYGYEPNAEWERLLNGVVADRSESVFRDGRRLWTRLSGLAATISRTASYRRDLRRSHE